MSKDYLEKLVSVGRWVIGAVFAAGVSWTVIRENVSSVTKRVSKLEDVTYASAQADSTQTTDIAVLKSQFISIQSSLERIERKMDRR